MHSVQKLFAATLRFAFTSVNWEEDGWEMRGEKLCSLEYADDFAVLASSHGELERMAGKLMNACE